MSTQRKNTTKANEEGVRGYWAFIIGKEQLADWLAVILTTLAGCLFITRFLPFPASLNDSFGYLKDAIDGRSFSYRPFGYPAFLQFVHIFSDSIHSVIISNALIYSIPLALLSLAVKKYWGGLKRWRFITFEIIATLSFSAIYMLNTILSDSLLCGMIFLMLAMLLVVINENSEVALAIYLLAFFVALYTRYSSMFLLFAVLPVLFFTGSRTFRIISTTLTVAVFLVFRAETRESMYESVHQKKFSSGFAGWQLSNNAFHILPYVSAEDGMPDDRPIMMIHRLCVDNFDEFIAEKTNNGKVITSAFMWDEDSPLKQILYSNIQSGEISYGKEWVRLGSGPYFDYGKWLILHFPMKFLRYYLLPNMKSIFLPRAEVEAFYTPIPAGKEEIVQWFDFPAYKTMEQRSDWFYRNVTPLLPWVELFGWILLAAASAALFIRCRWKEILLETRLSLILIFALGFIYYGSICFASPIALRYWMPMHAVKLVFVWIALSQSKLL